MVDETPEARSERMGKAMDRIMQSCDTLANLYRADTKRKQRLAIEAIVEAVIKREEQGND